MTDETSQAEKPATFTTEEIDIGDGGTSLCFTYDKVSPLSLLNISAEGLDISIVLHKDELARLISDADLVHAMMKTA